MWLTIQSFFLNWGLQLLVAFIGFLGLVFRKEISEFWKYKQSTKKNLYLKEVYGKIDKEKKASIQADKEILDKMDESDKEILRLMNNMKEEIMGILNPLREATLSSHLDSLILKCQEYVIRGWITPDELDRIEADYATYKSLRGNGHMDDWIARVRKLEIKNREEQ